jgi:SAM-dependent methyltransferase
VFSESAGFYDLIYGRMKDYAAEARTIAALIERERPGARTVLDVACGTGEHARHLIAEHALAVDGIDLDAAFVEIAARKNPNGGFTRADMRDFDLGRTYDAVICMFSAIGYAGSVEGVTAALARFRAHLSPGGVAIVEPWFTPEMFFHGRVFVNTTEGDGVTVCRMSHSSVEGRMSRVRFEYLIGRADGLTRASELHELGLFTTDEMRACFTAAGLACDYDPVGPTNRGLFVARAA